MADFELSHESNALLPDNATREDDRDAEEYNLNQQRLKKTRRRRLAIIAAAVVVGIFFIVGLVHMVKAIRHRKSHYPDSPVTQLEPQYFSDYGSKRVQIKYGPFKVPGSNHNNGMKNFKIPEAKAPCTGCLVTWMQAGLEFIDGSYANADTGMWLHHTVVANRGRHDVTSCKPNKPQKFFASGNERSVVDLTLNGTEKSGYWLDKNDKIGMSTELMNELEHHKEAILTIEYEYIPYVPEDFSKVTIAWLDAGNCKGSEIPVPKDKSSFEVDMSPWTSTVSGRVISVLSHIHDGGVYLDVLQNDKKICRSTATYGDPSEHKHHMPGMDMSHISYLPTCYDTGRIEAGDQWTVKALYDLNKHEPMLDKHGKPDGVMGIALLYVAED